MHTDIHIHMNMQLQLWQTRRCREIHTNVDRDTEMQTEAHRHAYIHLHTDINTRTHTYERAVAVTMWSVNAGWFTVPLANGGVLYVQGWLHLATTTDESVCTGHARGTARRIRCTVTNRGTTAKERRIDRRVRQRN